MQTMVTAEQVVTYRNYVVKRVRRSKEHNINASEKIIPRWCFSIERLIVAIFLLPTTGSGCLGFAVIESRRYDCVFTKAMLDRAKLRCPFHFQPIRKREIARHIERQCDRIHV